MAIHAQVLVSGTGSRVEFVRGDSFVNVEQGSTNPTIGTLLRLSDALGIGLRALVDTSDDPRAPVTVRRAADQTPAWTTPAGGSATMVAGTTPPDVCEPWDWRLGPGDTHDGEALRASTRELLLVLSGTVDLQVDDPEHRLKTGDSATYGDGRLTR